MMGVFEDCERTMAELNYFFFKTLYLWTTALDFNFLSFHDLLNLFFSFWLDVSLVTP